MADNKAESFFMKYKWWIFGILMALVLSLSIASIVLSTEPEKPYTESLYSDVLNPATLKKTDKLELLYSYTLNSGQGDNSGFFTIVVDGKFDFPNMTFDVQDQDGRSIISNDPVVGKTTTVNFSGRSDTTIINLYIYPTREDIKLKSLTINLNR